jgi:light-harvesting complex 1 beta chain
MSEENRSLTGLSSREAKEFHKYFMLGFIVFTVIAIVAHFLVWQWRPWLPGPEGYAAVTDSIHAVANSVITRLS